MQKSIYDILKDKSLEIKYQLRRYYLVDFGSNFFPKKKTQSGIHIMSSSEFRSFDKKIHQGTSHFKYLISRDLTLAFAVLHCTTQRTNLSVRSKIFCSSQNGFYTQIRSK